MNKSHQNLRRTEDVLARIEFKLDYLMKMSQGVQTITEIVAYAGGVRVSGEQEEKAYTKGIPVVYVEKYSVRRV